MKRSSKIQMCLLTTVIATALSGCNDEDNPVKTTEGYYFTNDQKGMSECYKTFDVGTCDQLSEKAKQNYEDSATKFDSMDACIDHINPTNYQGQCVERTSNWDHSLYYIPVMSGFMISKLLDKRLNCQDDPNNTNCKNGSGYSYSGGGHVSVAPFVYINGNPYYGRYSTGMAMTNPSPTVSTITTSPPPAPRAAGPAFSASSRGGFGSSAHASGIGE